MDQPKCPFCETLMDPRAHPGLDEHFRFFHCHECNAQLKQPRAVAPQVKREAKSQKGGHEDCHECAFGDVTCSSCDDSLCPQHVRTFEKYSEYFSKELAEELKESFGRRIYCPLCFQMTIKRFSATTRMPSKPPGGTFNFPIILGLLSVFLIIMIGLRRCDSAKLLREPPTTIEQTDSSND